MSNNIFYTVMLAAFIVIFIACFIKTELLEEILKLFKKIPKPIRIILYILVITGITYIIGFEINKYFLINN